MTVSRPVGVQPLIYQVDEWRDADGRRHLELTVELPVMPYTRQTRTTRWRQVGVAGARARAYNESRGEIRDALFGIMLAKRLQPFAAVPLGMAATFWVKNARQTDLGNLEKALEDAGNSILYPDDRYIYQRGEGGKYQGDGKFQVHIWEVAD